jgi:hypothetical protein
MRPWNHDLEILTVIWAYPCQFRAFHGEGYDLVLRLVARKFGASGQKLCLP